MAATEKMMLLAVVGPESSGKTTLSAELSLQMRWPWVPEYSREFLEQRGGVYVQSDLRAIARGQADRVTAVANGRHKGCITDTFLLDIVVWSEQKYGSVDPDIAELHDRFVPDLYLLCRPDIPWVHDPLRENPHRREDLFEAFRAALSRTAVPWVTIEGQGAIRLQTAMSAVLRFIENPLHL